MEARLNACIVLTVCRRRLSNGSLLFERVEHSTQHRPDDGVYQCAARLAASRGTIVSPPASLTIACNNLLTAFHFLIVVACLYAVSRKTDSQYRPVT